MAALVAVVAAVVVTTLVRVPWVVLRLRLGLVVVGSLVDADRATAERRLDKVRGGTCQNVCCNGSANQIVVVLEEILLSIDSSGLAEFADLIYGIVVVRNFLDSAGLNSSS